MRMNLLSTLALSFTLFSPACNDDNNDNGDGGDDAGDDGAGDCAGPVTDCRLADLSESQKANYCDTLLAAIDDEPGTVYACDSNGLSLTLSTSAECVANEVLPDCPITVDDSIDCYKAAKVDACAAFAEDGACAPIFDQLDVCV